jgi:hypothetical protein
MVGTTGFQGIPRPDYSWNISQQGGINNGVYIVFKAYQAFNIMGVSVGLADSGSGGAGTTVFQVYVLPAGSLPAVQPSGAGNITVTVIASGNAIMNEATQPASVNVLANQYVIIGVTATPAVLPNYAQITLQTG